MPSHRQRRKLPYSADDMFALVADIDSYPEFLPWCTGIRILERGPFTLADGREGERVLADLLVGFKLIRERFRSEVTLDRDGRAIDIRYIEGPFRYLRNEWRFHDEDEGGSEIEFFIEFEFKSRTLRLLMSGFFDEAVRLMVSAFERRAHALYRRRERLSGQVAAKRA